jgi:voltage-gated potassium channel
VLLDIAIIAFFLATSVGYGQTWFWIVDYVLAALLALDMLLRLHAMGTLRRWLGRPNSWVDIVVLLTLLFPAALYNWGFLRVLRLWTIVQRERFWNLLGGGRWDDTYVEDITKAATNLVVFVFLAAGFAQVAFLGDHPKLNNFVDALYFVVTSLTTTGYGDITIDTAAGRLFSIALMIAGISLFFGLAQKVFAPRMRFIACPSCGLDRHEPNAKHCRNCGAALPIAKPKEAADG